MSVDADQPVSDDLDEEPDRPDCREDLDHLEYHNPETGETAPFRCKSWECVCCGHHMKMNLIEEIDRVVERLPELSRLLSLTTDPSRFESRKEAHRVIGKAWNRLRNYLQSAYGDFSFIWVREENEDGWPHLHILVSRFLPKSAISAAWDRAGMGSIVDIKRVEAREAGHYIAKYLAKDAMANLPSGVHRYGSSEDIDLDVRGGTSDGDSEWTLLAEDPITGLMLEARPADFVRSSKPPPVNRARSGSTWIQTSLDRPFPW